MLRALLLTFALACALDLTVPPVARADAVLACRPWESGRLGHGMTCRTEPLRIAGAVGCCTLPFAAAFLFLYLQGNARKE